MYPTNSNVVWRGGLPPVFSVVVWPMDDMGRKRPRYTSNTISVMVGY